MGWTSNFEDDAYARPCSFSAQHEDHLRGGYESCYDIDIENRHATMDQTLARGHEILFRGVCIPPSFKGWSM